MSEGLRAQYRRRFTPQEAYRQEVWRALTEIVFQPLLPAQARVLDLGCGWGEFINHIRAAERWGMDLNPDSPGRLDPAVRFVSHDCTRPWPLESGQLDVIFSSNLFEHLPTKAALADVLQEAFRCLAPGGRLICMGPNIRCIPGAYWDFWDHHLPLTELSLSEILELTGFRIQTRRARFVPYSMALKKLPPPLWSVRLYLRLPWLWRWFGEQFLIVAVRPAVPTGWTETSIAPV